MIMLTHVSKGTAAEGAERVAGEPEGVGDGDHRRHRRIGGDGGDAVDLLRAADGGDLLRFADRDREEAVGFVAADGTPSAKPTAECEEIIGRVEAVMYDAFYGERYITDALNAYR